MGKAFPFINLNFGEVGAACLKQGSFSYVGFIKGKEEGHATGSAVTYTGDKVKIQYYQYYDSRDYIAAYAVKKGKYLVVANASVKVVSATAGQCIAYGTGTYFIMAASLF